MPRKASKKRKNEIIAVSYVKIDDVPVRFDELPADQRTSCISRMLGNIGKAVSDYLSANPDEAETFLAASEPIGEPASA